MATDDTLEIQIDKLGKSLVASRAEYKTTLAELKAAKVTIAQQEALGPNPNGEAMQKFVASSVAAGVASGSNELQQKVAALETQLAAATAANTEINGKFASAAVATEIREACRASHVKSEAMGDAIAIGSTELHMIDGEVRTADGLSASEWIEQRKATAGYWWPSARGSGARGSSDTPIYGGTNPFLKSSWNMTAQSMMAAQNPELATRLKSEADASMLNK